MKTPSSLKGHPTNNSSKSVLPTETQNHSFFAPLSLPIFLRVSPYKLEFASKSDGFEFTTKGALKGDSIASSFEAKQKMCHGFSIKKTLDPSKAVADVEIEYNNVAKITACTSWPITGCPIPALNKIKLAWSNDKVNLNMDTDAKSALNADAVFAHGSTGGVLEKNEGGHEKVNFGKILNFLVFSYLQNNVAYKMRLS